MARRRSEGFHRREHEARERRRQRLIMLGAGGVIGVVALVVAIGFVVTVVLPPRASALVVGDEVVTAGEVADRAQLLVRFSGGVGPLGAGEFADRAVDQLIREEVLRQAGRPLIGDVSDEDVRRITAEQLGFPDDVSDEQFESMYRDFREAVGASRAELDRMMRAEATREALRDHFEEQLDESGPQVRLLVAASEDEGRIAELRDRVVDGEDFVDVAVELELADEEGELDQGWRAEESLQDEVRSAIEGLEAGEVSGIVHEGGGMDFVLYFVAERESDREYDEAVRAQLAEAQLTDFVDEQREQLDVRVELSQRERDWVLRQVRRA